MNAKEISLEERKVKPVVDLMNDYLANYHIHYQKIRGCHWNVKGNNFFTLHIKFEELYNTAVTTIDEIAERVLSLGKSPHSTYADYIKESKLKEVNTIGMGDEQMVKALLEDMEALIAMEREILEVTEESKDQGTNDMVNGFMQYKEKNHWMLRSFIGKN